MYFVLSFLFCPFPFCPLLLLLSFVLFSGFLTSFSLFRATTVSVPGSLTFGDFQLIMSKKYRIDPSSQVWWRWGVRPSGAIRPLIKIYPRPDAPVTGRAPSEFPSSFLHRCSYPSLSTVPVCPLWFSELNHCRFSCGIGREENGTARRYGRKSSSSVAPWLDGGLST